MKFRGGLNIGLIRLPGSVRKILDLEFDEGEDGVRFETVDLSFKLWKMDRAVFIILIVS